METLKGFLDWQFSPLLPGVWSAAYLPALWYVALVNAVSFYSLLVILTRNTRPNPILFRAAIVGLAIALIYGMAQPIVGLYAPVTCRNILGASCLALFLSLLASGRVSIEVRLNHKKVVGIEVDDETKGS